ncbi:hypothetical protein OHB05_42215 [Streptomyces sp. NBC_00638]|uniref:hypothetical protein n=1 Tax=unclassified Streptomyces TaxID=2593676 RepID=UPI00224D2C87|nr:hypothetical protein [Streptomyces sp. NBC_00638]MCX5009135.1 hypothetical protein [Streptomyces sp. NBC_00638]
MKSATIAHLHVQLSVTGLLRVVTSEAGRLWKTGRGDVVVDRREVSGPRKPFGEPVVDRRATSPFASRFGKAPSYDLMIVCGNARIGFWYARLWGSVMLT